jgi:hypothetical protein
LTSVVCSIVLANPDKFYDIAMILFNTIELFHLDSVRSTNEFLAKSNYSIGYGLNKIKDVLYTDERLKTCEDKHRTSNLESLFLNYQFIGIKGFTDQQNTEFIKKMHEIIDQFKSNISTNPKSEEKSWGILLARMDSRNLTSKITRQDDHSFFVELTPTNLAEDLREDSEQAVKQIEETFKYSSLRIWSNFLIGKNSQNTNQKHEVYDNNPLIALSETKQLVEELNSGQSAMRVFDYSIPAFSCSKLMIKYKDNLSKEDKDFCKEVILASISQLFSDDYGYQISDGVEASFHAIPSLIFEYPDQTEDFISIMVLSLFDETEIGAYKRICDYVVEAVHGSQLWEQKSDVAQAILFGYIKLKPFYKSIYDERKQENGFWGRIPKSSFLEELNTKLIDFTFAKVSIDIHDIDSFDIHDLEIIYQLIPSNTKDEIHLKIFDKSLPLFASQLLKDRRSYREENGNDSNIYLIRLHIFKRFASFILQREITEIDI